MDSETSTDSAKCCQCWNCICGCDCSVAATLQSSRSTKRRYDSRPASPESVAKVETLDECSALREALSRQQQAVKDLAAELEEERNAASSAANEAMSMILRLQKEKAEVQMEARQFKRIVEERSSHDQKELLELEDLLYKREQTIQSLNCEVQAYKHRLMSFGLTESEADCEEFQVASFDYPQLKCNILNSTANADNNDADVEKYIFGETPRDRLRNLENRISQMERSPTYSQMEGDFPGKNFLEKVVVGQSPRRSRRKYSFDSASFGPELLMDSPKITGGNFSKIEEEPFSNLKKVENNASEAGDEIYDKVYTVDSGYNCFNQFKGALYDDFPVTTPRDFGNNIHGDFEDPYIKKLYMRLQALEADRESMRQAIISMRTDKAQLVLLKEIAQQLCKEMSPQRKRTARKSAMAPFSSVFKWVVSIVFWRKKSHEIRYIFGVPSESVGLLMLINKEPRVKSWRYIARTQLED
ncbi:hypothetical protein HN51_017425 [Arachis hypogaea]|uniref:GTD-binding domain-containing protein n=1 Tax=Arachis hypogaea TaxID=3818 RepID=A0A445CX78_ARAHY|nr:myosin-binding protein 7-like [Arachis ipaensis]XP_025660085.1 myosin-binding protein 7-like [Arachis hypogaea]QHN88724.1 Myosin-binding protein [Arachis hypogaea]RYR55529.1 hypothetical protein Ahy_A06g030727 [Arachis hypogaea]